jgi:lipopolysaccharide transport protein LptA
MARSRPNNRRLHPAPGAALSVFAAAWLTLAGGSAGAANAAAALGENNCTEDIEVKADSFAADNKGHTTELKNVTISQCDIRVQARHASATGLNFDNTRWTFDGDVHIDVENRGSLRSDQAVVDFQNNQISKATITGNPAEFEQRHAETDQVARGHAGEIVYEVGPGTVRLTDDAWLKYGTTEMKGSRLIYNIRQENVQGASQPGDNKRVTIRISPKKPDAKGGGANSPKPPSAPAPKTP